jgi:hypothetical protein
MAIHKLANGPLTITVVGVEQTEGQFGPQVLFTGDDGTMVYVSLSSATSQLDRAKLTFETAVGQRLHFEQVKKDGKTFTNINRVTGGAPLAPAASAAPARATAPSTLSFDEIVALYANCVNAAIVHFGARIEEAGITPDAASIQAAAATMFIKATR